MVGLPLSHRRGCSLFGDICDLLTAAPENTRCRPPRTSVTISRRRTLAVCLEESGLSDAHINSDGVKNYTTRRTLPPTDLPRLSQQRALTRGVGYRSLLNSQKRSGFARG